MNFIQLHDGKRINLDNIIYYKPDYDIDKNNKPIAYQSNYKICFACLDGFFYVNHGPDKEARDNELKRIDNLANAS